MGEILVNCDWMSEGVTDKVRVPLDSPVGFLEEVVPYNTSRWLGFSWESRSDELCANKTWQQQGYREGDRVRASEHRYGA